MSYHIKSKDYKYIMSFSCVSNQKYRVLATNLKNYYYEELDDEDLEDKIYGTSLRLKADMIQKFLKHEPIKTEINLEENNLKLSLEYEINSKQMKNSFKIEFKLIECTSVEKISEFFIKGLMKSSLMESMKQNGMDEKYQIEETNTFGCLAVTESNIHHVCNLIGVEIKTKDKESKEEVSDSKSGTTSKTKTKVKALKRKAVVEKKFMFENNDSQEIEDDNESANTAEVPIKSQRLKTKKPSIKFL